MIKDYKDIYIRYYKHPKYNSTHVIEDKILEVIIQKIEMLLFTNKGEILGDPNFGCNIEYYLWQTKVPATMIKKVINEQIIKYIPELIDMEYAINLELYEGTVRDILYINIVIKDNTYKFIYE